MEEIIMVENIKNYIKKTKVGGRVLFRHGTMGAGFIAGKEREDGGFFGMYYLEFFDSLKSYGELRTVTHKVTYGDFVSFHDGIVEYMAKYGFSAETYREEMAYN